MEVECLMASLASVSTLLVLLGYLVRIMRSSESAAEIGVNIRSDCCGVNKRSPQ
jgi:energy-converting hydrogenase Eha subunit C